MRDWRKYHNKQKHQDCQLITAVNAYYYLTDKVIKQDTKRYEKLIKLCGAVAGSAICIEKVYKKLGMKITKEGKFSHDFTNEFHYYESSMHDPTSPKLPVEVSVWHQDYGFHSVLVVDYSPKAMAVRVTNFSRATNKQGWIFIEDFMHYIRDTNVSRCCRWIGLK